MGSALPACSLSLAGVLTSLSRFHPIKKGLELRPFRLIILLPFCYHNKPKQDKTRGKTKMAFPQYY